MPKLFVSLIFKYRKEERAWESFLPPETTHTPSLIDTIIIFDIPRKNYSFSEIKLKIAEFLSGITCPACLASQSFSCHAVYKKYYFNEQIEILRVRCKKCKATHAVIPSFSLPNTSIGTEEAEEYLLERKAGVSRKKAGKMLIKEGLSLSYLKTLDKLLSRCILHAKALFPDTGNSLLSGLNWLSSVLGPTNRPIYDMNVYCLRQGHNPVFCSRFNILEFKNRRAGKQSSHNLNPEQDFNRTIDSS